MTAAVNDELTLARIERDQAWEAYEDLKGKMAVLENEIQGLKRFHYRNRPFITGFDRISAVTLGWQGQDEAGLRRVLAGVEEVIASQRRKVNEIESKQDQRGTGDS